MDRLKYPYSPLQTSEESPRPPSRRKYRPILILIVVSSILIVAVITRGFPSTRYTTGTACSGLPTHHSLPSGDKIPSVALGVWRSSKSEVGAAVKTAFAAGYRHIDGAWIYGNEVEVGQAIKESGVNRSDIFITSKLWNTFHHPSDVEEALDDTLSKLATPYVDLYLIHWPVAFVPDPNSPDKDYKRTPEGKPLVDKDLTHDELLTWRAMELLVKKGKARNIGVSKQFQHQETSELTQSGISIQPAVNQVEINFWNPQPELIKWAKENNVLLEAYSPLGSSSQVKNSLNVPEVKAVAKELSITPAQVLISWAVQRGLVVLPKSVTPSRIRENFQVTALPQKAFDKIEKAATGHPPRRVSNPSAAWGVPDIFDD